MAAVILFTLFLGIDFQVHAFFGDSSNEQSLITEESLRAQLEEIEERILREGSYVYSSGYRSLGQASDFDEGFGGGELSGNILVQGIAFLSPSNPSPDFTNGLGIYDRQRSGVITYEVQSGDTPSYIAASFGISTNTLLWANNLSYWSVIKPGQKLVILPTSGVIHNVKKGETLSGIVNKYKGDFEKTIAYNGLPADGSLKPGQEIVIPGGKEPVYYQPIVQYTYSYRPGNYYGPYGNMSHRFPWGQCTWYVAQKRLIPWGGHAKYWLDNAERYGFQTGIEPRAGAIMSTSETWYGHVAYVEAVNGDYITVSEMHLGQGALKTRVFLKDDRRIRGYIY